MSRCLLAGLVCLTLVACSGTHSARSTPVGAREAGPTHPALHAGKGSEASATPPTVDANTDSADAASLLPACPSVKPGLQRGKLAPDALNEASGVVESRSHPGVLWLHNDSGDSARVFAVGTDGATLGEVAVSGAAAVDWEDIATGPGPEVGKLYLYAGDIGDNNAKRSNVQIYRFEEPLLDAQGKPTNTSIAADRIDVVYEDGAHDAETLLLDPLRAELFIVTKGGDAGAYRLGAPGAGGSSVVARKVLSLPIFLADGGDVSPDGRGVAVRSYTSATYYRRNPAEPLEKAFVSPACPLRLADVGTQGEALGFAADGKGYFTVAEGAHAPLYYYAFE
jgi:hypothetical protein